MKYRIGYYVLALAITAAPLAAHAQNAPDTSAQQRERWERGGMKHGPWGGSMRFDRIGYLLERRADLKLTDAQVTRLTEVRRQLQEQNRPLIARLDSLRASVRGRDGRSEEPTAEEREAWRERREAARPTFRQLRANYRRAMDTVRSVLTPEQRDRARALLAQERRARHERRSG